MPHQEQKLRVLFFDNIARSLACYCFGSWWIAKIQSLDSDPMLNYPEDYDHVDESDESDDPFEAIMRERVESNSRNGSTPKTCATIISDASSSQSAIVKPSTKGGFPSNYYFCVPCQRAYVIDINNPLDAESYLDSDVFTPDVCASMNDKYICEECEKAETKKGATTYCPRCEFVGIYDHAGDELCPVCVADDIAAATPEVEKIKKVSLIPDGYVIKPTRYLTIDAFEESWVSSNPILVGAVGSTLVVSSLEITALDQITLGEKPIRDYYDIHEHLPNEGSTIEILVATLNKWAATHSLVWIQPEWDVKRQDLCHYVNRMAPEHLFLFI